MFLRKSAVAWKKCIPGNLMAENEAKCAIEIAANSRFLQPHEVSKIFKAGLDIQGDSDYPRHINFVVFL
jgi:hypothetical protein